MYSLLSADCLKLSTVIKTAIVDSSWLITENDITYSEKFLKLLAQHPIFFKVTEN